MCGGGGGGDAEKEIRKQNLTRETNIRKGMEGINTAFGQYDSKYFGKVRDTTRGILLPQVHRQYGQMKDRLATTLADKGILRSSASKKAATDLEYDRSMAQIAVENQANTAVRDASADVQREKQNATSLLISSNDPTIAAQQAVSSAASLNAPSIVAPLGDMFTNFANIYLAGQYGKLYGAPSGRGPAENIRQPAGAKLPENYIR